MTPRTRSSVVLLVVAVLGLSACSGLDLEVDHRTSSAPEPLSDAAPPLGTYVPAWTTQLAGAPTEFHLVGAQVVAVEEGSLAAYDARTGEPSWHYREPGRNTYRVLPVGETVILSTYRAEQDENSDSTLVTDEHTIGIDAGTGEVLWETTDDWEVDTEGSAGGASVGDTATASVAVIEPDGPFSRAGIDPRTGDELWRADANDVAEACTTFVADNAAEAAADADAALVVTDITCEQPQNAVVALDAASGELRWRRPLPYMSGGTFVMRGGATLFDIAENPPLIVGPDGADLFEGEPGTSCPCDLVAAADQLVLRYSSAESDDLAVVIDPESGTATPVEGWPQNYGDPLFTGSGRIVTTDTDASSSLLPTMLGTLDVSTGDLERVPLLWPQPNQLSNVAWRAMAEGNLLTVRRLYEEDGSTPAGAVLASYEPVASGEPLILGGVSAADWPNACSLLTSVPVEVDVDEPGADDAVEAPPDLYSPGGPVQVGDQTLQDLWCSRWAAAGYDAYAEVKWVAATEEQAAALMRVSGPLNWVGATSTSVAGYAAPGVDELQWWPNKQLLMRVGPVIVLVNASVPAEIAKPMIAEIARQLQVFVAGG